MSKLLMWERAFFIIKLPFLFILVPKLQIFIAYLIVSFNYCESYLTLMILPQLSLTDMNQLLIGEIMFSNIKCQYMCDLVYAILK